MHDFLFKSLHLIFFKWYNKGKSEIRNVCKLPDLERVPKIYKAQSKRKFNSACNTIPFENQKENTDLNVYRIHKKWIHLWRGTAVLSVNTTRHSLQAHLCDFNCLVPTVHKLLFGWQAAQSPGTGFIVPYAFRINSPRLEGPRFAKLWMSCC